MEVRALQRPPDGVRIVIEAVSIMRGVKPKKVAGDKVRMICPLAVAVPCVCVCLCVYACGCVCVHVCVCDKHVALNDKIIFHTK